jgi:hypothetical protein
MVATIIVIAVLIFFSASGWAIYGFYLAPSKKEKAQVLRKFHSPAHMEGRTVFVDYLGSPTRELSVVSSGYYLVVIVNGSENYLGIDEKTWKDVLVGDSIDVEYSIIFGLILEVRKFHIGEKVFR